MTELPLANEDQKDELIRRKQELSSEMRALGRLRWKTFDSPRP